MRLELTHSITTDEGLLTLEWEAFVVWEDGADDPAENGWVCEEAALTGGVLRDETGLHELGIDATVLLTEWAHQSLALIEAHIAERAVEEATAAGSPRHQHEMERVEA